MKQTRGAHGFRLGYILGLVYAGGAVYWIGANSGTYRWAAILSAILAVAFIALNYALFGWALSYLYRKQLPGGLWWSPAIWIGIQYLRSFGILIFPWLSLSLTQTHYLPSIQIGSITGMHGVSFWVVLLNVAIFHYLEARDQRTAAWKWGALALAIYLAPIIYGTVVLQTLPGHQQSSSSVNVGIVQPNVDPNQKWDKEFRRMNYALLDSLTMDLAGRQPDIIIWPETATPSYIRYNRYGYRDFIQRRVDSLGIPLLTGTPDVRMETDTVTGGIGSKTYNAAVLFEPGESISQVYRKIKLVPFAEFIPYRNIFGFFSELELGQGEYTPGTEYTVFQYSDSRGGNMSTAICYDSSFPKLIRRFRQQGAEWLAIITNDAWFGNSSGPYQHARLAVMRAVENRMPVARSANTGISMVIDPWGRVQKKLPLHEQGVLTGTLRTGIARPFYSKYGEVFGFVITLIGLAGLGWSFFR